MDRNHELVNAFLKQALWKEHSPGKRGFLECASCLLYVKGGYCIHSVTYIPGDLGRIRTIY